jgi:Tol biopolymer transport system component
VSLATGGAQANGHSIEPAMSGDGRYVAFYSDASNLVAGDANRAQDVFVTDRQTGETTRVSVGAGGAEANGDSFAPAISADGRYVVFSSAATNLVDGDTNRANDIFVRDRVAGTTTRISLGPGGVEANGSSYTPAISADGSTVAYTSDATNLVAGDVNSVRDVFVYGAGTTSLVSVSTNGTQANAPTATPALDADGKIVAFASFADNLVLNDLNETSDIFVRDRQAGTLSRASVYNGGFEGDGDSFRPALSADGRLVAFDSNSFNLAWGDPDEGFDVYVYDRQADVLQPVSADDAGNLGNDTSEGASMSSDGRYVAFSTEATDIVPGDQNGASDIVLYDRQSSSVKRLSVTNSGDEADADSLHASISADGTLVAYESNATNLVAGDTNRRSDIFLSDTTANPPPPPPAARCAVPRVVGLRLAAARKRITRAHCAVGKVRRVRAARRRVGRVISQSPRAGTRRAAGGKVNLVVGRRR